MLSSSTFRIGLLLAAGMLCGVAFGMVEDGANALLLVGAGIIALSILLFVMFQRPSDEDERAPLDLMLGDMDDPVQRRIMLRSGLWGLIHLASIGVLVSDGVELGGLVYLAFVAFVVSGFLIGLETWWFATYDEFLRSFYLRALALTGLFFVFFVFVLEGARAWLGLGDIGLFAYYLGFSVILLSNCLGAKNRTKRAEKA